MAGLDAIESLIAAAAAKCAECTTEERRVANERESAVRAAAERARAEYDRVEQQAASRKRDAETALYSAHVDALLKFAVIGFRIVGLPDDVKCMRRDDGAVQLVCTVGIDRVHESVVTCIRAHKDMCARVRAEDEIEIEDDEEEEEEEEEDEDEEEDDEDDDTEDEDETTTASPATTSIVVRVPRSANKDQLACFIGKDVPRKKLTILSFKMLREMQTSALAAFIEVNSGLKAILDAVDSNSACRCSSSARARLGD